MDKRAMVVTAFLEFMVDQLVPSSLSVAEREASQKFKHQSLAQQVHSLVLLYNYYYRKQQYPLVPFVPFEEFCNLLVSLRPTLSAFMKLTKSSRENENKNEPISDYPKYKLSITEQKIKEACDISTHLDASKDSPKFGEWPITKVAVLLVDYWFEDCYLTFGSNTKGTWSLVEQEVDNVRADAEELLQIAYSAVRKQAAVRWEEDAMLLESYTAYSHTKEKAATKFYIMKYSGYFNMANRVPLKDVTERMKGALVRETECGGAWMLVNPAVDYFPLLPYSVLISDWFACLSNRVYPKQPFRLPGTSAANKLSKLKIREKERKVAERQIRDWRTASRMSMSELESRDWKVPSPDTDDDDKEKVERINSSSNGQHHHHHGLVKEAAAVAAVVETIKEEEIEPVREEAAAVVGAAGLAKEEENTESEDKKEVIMIRRVSTRKRTPNKRLAGYILL